MGASAADTPALDWPEPQPGVHLLGVIGWPVLHSLSPVIQSAALAALGLGDEWRYVHLPVPPGAMPQAMAKLQDDGYRGANVTMPHKESAAELATGCSSDVERLRAVNTLNRTDGGFEGHNTDAPGFANFLAGDVGFVPAGGPTLIFGAGGAARACALALVQMGVTEIIVAARDVNRGWAAMDGLVPQGNLAVIAFDDASRVSPALIVNATPVGSSGEVLPAPALSPEIVVVDLLYHPADTPLLAAARGAGARAAGGLGLLVHQGALSLEIWTGRMPDLAVMRAAGEAAGAV
ncbi:MAG: shikimate dehydrogenase [Actinomycetota bacterium]